MVPELLAPAGSLGVAITAYKNGADAVYAGLGRFNAREMADNFSYEDMSRLAEYARRRNKRYYLALNTLVKEPELEEVYSTLERVSALEPHGVIVQDIGLVRLIRTYFPSLSIHASTQMGLHNSAGVLAAQRMGIDRVILERQVTLDELTSIITVSPLEIEVFVHGALCCSLSGSCLFSSWIGGWSGNRGRCKQPCRRRFYHSDRGKKSSGFFFSTQDLYSLDLLDDLKHMGIASLKIEGRLKHEGYVARVVQAYRLVLDAPAEQAGTALGKAKAVLADSFGRKWSHGFFSNQDAEQVIQSRSLGVSGQLAGTVSQVRENGFYLETIRKVQTGDRIRIQPKSGDEGPALTITKMHIRKKLVHTARKGNTVFIHYPREVPVKGLVFLTEKTSRPVPFDRTNFPLYKLKKTINLAVSLSRTGIDIALTNVRPVLSWHRDLPLEKAEKHALDAAGITTLFRSTRMESVRTGVVLVSIKEPLFLPLSLLKQTRRDFWQWVKESFPGGAAGIETFREVPDFHEKVQTKQPDMQPVYLISCRKKKSLPGGSRAARPIEEVHSPSEEASLPHFTPEGSLPSLKSMIHQAYTRGIRTFRITSLFHIELLRKYPDISMVSSYPLPAANSLAARELHDLGIQRVQAWIELEKQAVQQMTEHTEFPV